MKERRVIYYKSIELWVYLQEALASPRACLHYQTKSKKNNIVLGNSRAAAILSILVGDGRYLARFLLFCILCL